MKTILSAARRLKRRVRLPNWAGYCPICEARTRFYAIGPWYRDQLRCSGCNSIPRERALMAVLAEHYPNWRRLRVHESSPADRGMSRKLRNECENYVASQYEPDATPGSIHAQGYRCENLEAQTFADGSFDLVITQDVFEHVFHPDLAIREIARTLSEGGAHLMTVPMVRKASPSVRRASLVDGQIVHHEPAEYHGNPVDPNGSLVTVDWGFDLATFLAAQSGMPTSIHHFADRNRGLLAEYLEVVVSYKRSPASIDDRRPESPTPSLGARTRLAPSA